MARNAWVIFDLSEVPSLQSKALSTEKFGRLHWRKRVGRLASVSVGKEEWGGVEDQNGGGSA